MKSRILEQMELAGQAVWVVDLEWKEEGRSQDTWVLGTQVPKAFQGSVLPSWDKGAVTPKHWEDMETACRCWGWGKSPSTDICLLGVQ